MDFGAATLAIVDAMGEIATITVDGVATEIAGAFRAPWTGEDTAGLPIDRQTPEFLVLNSVFNPTGAAEGDELAVAGDAYRIVNIEPDDSAASLLALAPVGL